MLSQLKNIKCSGSSFRCIKEKLSSPFEPSMFIDFNTYYSQSQTHFYRNVLKMHVNINVLISLCCKDIMAAGNGTR